MTHNIGRGYPRDHEACHPFALVSARMLCVPRIYEDLASGRQDDRPGMTTCLKALQPGNTLVVWKMDRLGRDLKHLVGLVETLNRRQVGLKVLAGTGAQIDTTTTRYTYVASVQVSPRPKHEAPCWGGGLGSASKVTDWPPRCWSASRKVGPTGKLGGNSTFARIR